MESLIFVTCHIIMGVSACGVFTVALDLCAGGMKNTDKVAAPKPQLFVIDRRIREIKQEFGLTVYCEQLFF